MAVYGYLRENYPEKIGQQLQRIVKYDCDFLFIESENDEKNTKELVMLEKISENDTIVVSDIRVFRKSLKEFMSFMTVLEESQVNLISISDDLDTREPLFFMKSLSLMTEMANDRERYLRQRVMEKSKAEGKTWGRPTIEDGTIERINRLYHLNNFSMREIADKCEVALGTVHKYLHQDKE